MHNTKIWHGRTGFSPESDLLLHRVRLNIDSLSYKETRYVEREDFMSLEKDDIEPQLLSQAEKHLEKALELRRCHNFQDAFKHYQKAIALASNNVKILYEFGDFLLMSGKFAIAEKFLKLPEKEIPFGSIRFLVLVFLRLKKLLGMETL